MPLPPEWLQINRQTLINSGVTNADGSVWGLTVVSARSGATVDVTPTVTHTLANNDYTFYVRVCEKSGMFFETFTPEGCLIQA